MKALRVEKNRQNNCSWINFFYSVPPLFTWCITSASFWVFPNWARNNHQATKLRWRFHLSCVQHLQIASDHAQCHPFRVSQRSQCRKPVKEGEEKRNSCKEICEFAELQEDKGRFGTQCWEAKWYFLSWVGVSPWKQIKTFSSLVPKMKLPKKVKCREKMVKATKPALPVKIGGYDIMDVDNCDVLSFKMRLKCSESRDQGCITSCPGYTDAFSRCAEDPRELVTLLCTAAWLQRGELVLAAKWVHKLNMRLEPVSPTFGVYTIAGVTCEKSRVFITICVYL